MRKKWGEEKIIEILREAEKAGSIQETCRKHGVHETTFYGWRRKYGGLDVPEAKRMRELEKENAQLRQLAGDQALANQVMREELKKKGLGVREMRKLVETLKQQGCSERRGCRALGLDRSSIRYEYREADEMERELIKRMTYWLLKHKRYGYRRVERELRREGHGVNHKKAYRLWTVYGLTLLRKKRRRRRGESKFTRDINAKRPNQVWSLDFMHDRTQYGVKLKILNVLDEYTREALTIHVEKSMKAREVKTLLSALVAKYGLPSHIRSDNGPEFIAKVLREWAQENGIEWIYIHPGHPWENGFVESFNGKFRDECLNMELIRSKTEAQVLANQWRTYYNRERMHSALDYKTPSEYRAEHESRQETQAFAGGVTTGVNAPSNPLDQTAKQDVN